MENISTNQNFDRFQMTESDHKKEESKLLALNPGSIHEVESMVTLIALRKQSPLGWIKDAFIVHIKDEYLGI